MFSSSPGDSGVTGRSGSDAAFHFINKTRMDMSKQVWTCRNPKKDNSYPLIPKSFTGYKTLIRVPRSKGLGYTQESFHIVFLCVTNFFNLISYQMNDCHLCVYFFKEKKVFRSLSIKEFAYRNRFYFLKTPYHHVFRGFIMKNI